MTQADSSLGQGSDASAFNFTLLSISFSHYNEKARWGMDYYGIPYTEYRSLPILHMLSRFKSRAKSRPATGTPFVTPHLTVAPANASDEKDVKISMNDSTEILSFLSDRFSAAPNKIATSTSTPPLNLYSNNAESRAKIMALEERFCKIIGPNVRRLVYSEILCHSPKSVGQSLGQHGNAGALQTWIWTWFFFFFSWVLIRFIRITPESAERSKDILKREFEHLSRVLESGPPGPAYLIGNEFTAADLTLASLGSLLVGVTQEDGYGAWVPPMSVFRPEAQEFLKELRESTAGQHILECYRLHRGKKAEGSKYGFSFFGWW